MVPRGESANEVSSRVEMSALHEGRNVQEQGKEVSVHVPRRTENGETEMRKEINDKKV